MNLAEVISSGWYLACLQNPTLAFSKLAAALLPPDMASACCIVTLSMVALQHWCVREAPTKMSPLLFGHCSFGGGGLDPCQDGLGHLFREELSKFKWAFALLWGVKMLARMVWGTYAVKIEVQIGNCLIVEGSKMFARMVCSFLPFLTKKG